MSKELRVIGRRRALVVVGGTILGCGGQVGRSSKPSQGSGDDAGATDAAIPDTSVPTVDASVDAPEEPVEILDTGTAEDVSDGRVSPPPQDASCTPGGVLAVTFAANPGLLEGGGSVMIMNGCYADPICGENGIVVVHTADGRYLAFSSSCTHACCNLRFTGSTLLCVCDGGTFDMTGKVVAGPPNMPLPVLPTTWDESAVYVTL